MSAAGADIFACLTSWQMRTLLVSTIKRIFSSARLASVSKPTVGTTASLRPICFYRLNFVTVSNPVLLYKASRIPALLHREVSGLCPANKSLDFAVDRFCRKLFTTTVSLLMEQQLHSVRNSLPLNCQVLFYVKDVIISKENSMLLIMCCANYVVNFCKTVNCVY